MSWADPCNYRMLSQRGCFDAGRKAAVMTPFLSRLQVFSGEVDESVRHEQQLLEGEIMRMLKLLDVSINHQVCLFAV